MKRSGFGNIIRQMRAARRRSGTEGAGTDGYYYWILGLKEGQRIVGGPYGTEQDAKTVARDSMDEMRYRIIPLRTRDPQRAKSILRHQLVTQDNISIDKAMEPMHRPTNITSID